MTRSPRFGRFTLTSLCLLCVFAMTACKPASTRPETLPTPPSVACDVPKFTMIPPVPLFIWMDEWAATVMGLYEDAATKAGATNRCLADLRAKGVIR